MLIDFSELEPRKAYFWMASTITPRPVAWVSSVSAEGVVNLAPFSFFQMVTASPPTLMISPLVHANGSLKDTTRNIRETGQFVVNLVSFDKVHDMNQTSFGYGPDESELELCNIESVPSAKVRPPRVADVAVSFECRAASIQPYPDHAPSCHIILGEVLAAHIDQAILDENGVVDPQRLNLVSRMGADWYGRTRADENFTLKRPEGWDRAGKPR